MKETKTSGQVDGESECADDEVQRRSIILTRGPLCLELEILASALPLVDAAGENGWRIEDFAIGHIAFRVR